MQSTTEQQMWTRERGFALVLRLGLGSDKVGGLGQNLAMAAGSGQDRPGAGSLAVSARPWEEQTQQLVKK